MPSQHTTNVARITKSIFVAVCIARTAEARQRKLRGPPLPNWEAPWEVGVRLGASGEKFEARSYSTTSETANVLDPSVAIRLPAEYEPTAAVVMSWQYFTDVLQEIAMKIANAGVEVWMVDGPGSLSGVPDDLYIPLPLSSDSVWVRDYGPVGLLLNEIGDDTPAVADTRYRHYITRRDDDNVPCNIADQEGWPCYTTNLILDGGNLMSDGSGNLFMTTRTYDWNNELSRDEVDNLLKSYFGADHIHALDYAKTSNGDPADGTGHIDMFAKILEPCVVLVAEADGSPYREPLEEAATYFNTTECAPGETYKVHRIPGWVSGGQSTWYTYTNSLIVNDVVIMPSYQDGMDDVAENIYNSASPSLSVAKVNTDEPITYGGSVHCLTRQIPQGGV